MRESVEDAEEMQEWRMVSIRLTKRESGRRTVSELLESSGYRSEQQDSVSGPARSLPGT